MCEETLKVVATVFKKFLVVYGGFSEPILDENRREICYPQGKVHVATRSIQRINDGQLLGRKNSQLSQVVRDTEKYDFYWLKPLQ